MVTSSIDGDQDTLVTSSIDGDQDTLVTFSIHGDQDTLVTSRIGGDHNPGNQGWIYLFANFRLSPQPVLAGPSMGHLLIVVCLQYLLL